MESQNEQFVQSLLEQGEFATREQVIDAALERWRVQREELGRLRDMVQIGIDELDRGDSAPLDIEEIIAEGHEQLVTRSGQH